MATPRPHRLEQTRLPTRPARVVVSDPRSGRRIDVARRAPCPALAGWVALLWTTRWDLQGQAPHVAEMITDPTVNLVIERGASRLVGLQRRRFVRRLDGRGCMFGTRLRVGAIAALVPGDARQWTDRVVALRDVLSIDVDALELELEHAADDDAAFDALEQAWSGLAPTPTDEARMVESIVQRIAADGAIVRVQQLEATWDLEARVLQRLFARHVGATPKWVIRRARLQEAAARLASADPPPLAELAAVLAYADQAHFARDFKATIGVTPRAYVQRHRGG